MTNLALRILIARVVLEGMTSADFRTLAVLVIYLIPYLGAILAAVPEQMDPSVAPTFNTR